MSAFFSALWSRPATLSPLARFTVYNGVFYLVAGAALVVAPGAGAVAGGAPLVGQEAGLVRVVGVTVAIIGWFYVMGGRTGAASFGLATVVDRVLLPALLVPIWWFGGVDPVLVLPFAVLDPVLGLTALAIWARGGATSRT